MTDTPNPAAVETAPEAAAAPAAPVKRKRGQKEIFRLEPWQARLVEENLELGGYTVKRRTDVKSRMDEMYTLFPVLASRHRQQAGTLSGGEQQMLAIARALMMQPRLLLLDEPSFGLAPLIVEEIFGIMQRIRDTQKVGILLVEQNANLALDVADHAYVIETGRIVLGGPVEVVRGDPAIRKAYLGYQ